jgi:hypothetical protein
MEGAAPTVGAAADGGAVIAGGSGDPAVVPDVCCANAGNDTRAMWATAKVTLKVANRIGASLEIACNRTAKPR